MLMVPPFFRIRIQSTYKIRPNFLHKIYKIILAQLYVLNPFFSTANRSCSFVSNSFCIGSPFNITHNKNIVTTSIRLALKQRSQDTSKSCTSCKMMCLSLNSVLDLVPLSVSGQGIEMQKGVL